MRARMLFYSVIYYHKCMGLLKKLPLLELSIFLAIILTFLYKLDYHYFFTDEILYANRGSELLRGEFSGSLQVPPLPKYLAGVMLNFFDHNTFALRMPYALIGVISSFLVYFILKKEFGKNWGLVGAVLFATSRTIFDSTRMVMLEPLLHLFWLLFNVYFYRTFFYATKKDYVLTGIFFGLSIATKVTSLILIPFLALGFLYSVYVKNQTVSYALKNYMLIACFGFISVLVTYLHHFFSSGIWVAVEGTLRALKEVYFTKSEEGKLHVIGENLYVKSPWWAYVYYYVDHNGVLRPVLYALFALVAIASRSFFVLYWGTFCLFMFVFHQFSGVKNARYISSFEIPLLMLVIAGIYYAYSKISQQRAFTAVLLLVLGLMIFKHVNYLNNLKPTEYLGLWQYFKTETTNFTQYKRLYVFGSVRSMKWYRDLVPNKSMFLYRRDYDVMCPEFDTFDYFAFDKEELLKDPENFLYRYITANGKNFRLVSEIEDMYVYKKQQVFDSVLDCALAKE